MNVTRTWSATTGYAADGVKKAAANGTGNGQKYNNGGTMKSIGTPAGYTGVGRAKSIGNGATASRVSVTRNKKVK